MPLVVTLAGSPSATSRSTALLANAGQILSDLGCNTQAITIRDLPPEVLVYGRYDSADMKNASDIIRQADGIIISTPIYKAAYSGLLKMFLDLLPPNILENKVILPVAVGGSFAHTLALDYALRPVLAAMGAHHVLGSLYIIDSQLQLDNNKGWAFTDQAAEQQFMLALQSLSLILKSNE